MKKVRTKNIDVDSYLVHTTWHDLILLVEDKIYFEKLFSCQLSSTVLTVSEVGLELLSLLKSGFPWALHLQYGNCN